MNRHNTCSLRRNTLGILATFPRCIWRETIFHRIRKRLRCRSRIRLSMFRTDSSASTSISICLSFHLRSKAWYSKPGLMFKSNCLWPVRDQFLTVFLLGSRIRSVFLHTLSVYHWKATCRLTKQVSGRRREPPSDSPNWVTGLVQESA